MRLNCLKVPRRLTNKLLFFFDGKLVPQRRVKIRKDTIDLLVKSPKAGVSNLLWMCEPMIEPASRRRCGLPVISISVEQRAEPDEPGVG